MDVARWIALLMFASFAPGGAAQGDYTLLVFGDAGTGRAAQRRVAEAMAEACRSSGCDAALVLGDLIYPRGVTSIDDPRFATHFERPYEALGPFPFWMSPGNHDHRTAGSVDAQVAYTQAGRSARWRMPAAHYAVEGVPRWLHIYSFDTQRIVAGSADRAQVDQARAALCGKPGWRLLMGHHPVYSNGLHGDNAHVGSHVHELARDCGIQAYFAGHDHHQEHISTSSFEQFVQGAAAKTRRVGTESYAAEQRMTQRFARSRLGFAVVTLTERTMEVRYFDGTHGRAQQIYHCRATIDAPECVPAV